jgi:hypothetical protein
MVVSGEAPAGITAVNRGHDWGKQAYRCSRHHVHSWRSPLRPHTLGVCVWFPGIGRDSPRVVWTDAVGGERRLAPTCCSC